MKRFNTLVLILLWLSNLNGQGQPLSYYLPAQSYDANIPTPKAFLGYEIGEWHVTHDQLVYYMRALAAASDRVEYQEYARSHEDRPLLYLTISSKKNLDRIADIKKQHQQLSDPEKSDKVNIKNLPSVVYQGYSVHGNESSGANAALLVAYHLAASESKKVAELLENEVILLDPCMNPDGLHRFSTWVNMHKSKHPVTNTDSREFSEAWPGGRTNHYWFDLNRDWLLCVHPESKGRLKTFHEWGAPNILTDHHEMGSNATFFFQPGIPTRTNPITPQKNQDLTKEIGTYHAAALDQIGSLYYSEESYDDFYYGKGSTYPDVNGSIGILFEQASSRGHLRETNNGLLTFPFTIRNQVAASLSTQKAGWKMRKELLNYKRDFYKNAKKEVGNLKQSAFVFGESHDNSRLSHFIELLNRHQIEVYALDKSMESDGKQFEKGKAYVVPMAQRQSRLIQAIFEKRTSFKDSLFYDVSAWTLPLAFNLNYAALDLKSFPAKRLGKKMLKHEYTAPEPQQSSYAYLMEWDDYYTPKALNALLQKGIRAKVADAPFTMPVGKVNKQFDRGTILIPVQNQAISGQGAKADGTALFKIIKDIAATNNLTFHTVSSGSTMDGIDLGSNNFQLLKTPKVLLVGGSGASAYDVGEVWHLLDQRYEMPPVIVAADRLGRADLGNYTHIVMVNGSYGSISSSSTEKIKKWLQKGGVLTCSGNAIRWAKSKQLANVTYKENKKSTIKKTERRPYDKRSPDRGASLIGGAIFETELDLTHPLTYGIHNSKLPVFRRGTMAMNVTKNIYATPSIYTKEPLMAGYTSRKNQSLISESAAIIVTGIGRGKVICLADNMNFRGFWLGTNKIFTNALFFGHLISGQAAESAPVGE